MPNEMNARAEKFKQQRSKKERFIPVLTALALVVGLGTVWALAQPASAMAGKLICGMEEHTHTDECYERSLVCGLEEGEEHTHIDDCWQTELVCQLAEHTHTEECYAKPEPESKPESQPAETESVTSQPESSAESESESNSAEETEKPESQPESQPEADKDADKSEASQPESKPETDKKPDASQPESKPETDKKPDASQPESENADDSSVSTPETDSENDLEEPQEQEQPQAPLLDQLPKEIPAEYMDIRSTTVSDGVNVRVHSKPGTLPENVEVRASLFDEQDAEFANALQRLNDAGIVHDFVTAMDISLYNEQGQKVEPNEPVYVELEAAGLMARESDFSSIQIQHHKEIVSAKGDGQSEGEQAVPAVEPQIVLQEVLNSAKGLLSANTESASFTATFAVDSFSTFTITSQGWKELKIKVQCVDERGIEIPRAGKDIELGANFNSDKSFSLVFSKKENPNHVSDIEGYVFDEKAYYMRAGNYEAKIYGLRRENGKWYYLTQRDRKVDFEQQPDFQGEAPNDFIRLMYKKVSRIPVQYVDLDGNMLRSEDVPNNQNPASIERKGHFLDTTDIDAWPKCPRHYYIGRAYVKEHGNPDNDIVKVFEKDQKVFALTAENVEMELTSQNPLKLVYAPILPEPKVSTRVTTRDKGMKINIFQYNSGANFESGPINEGKSLQFSFASKNPEQYNRWTGNDGGLYMGIVQDELGADGYPVVALDKYESLNYLFDPEMCKKDLETNKGNGMIRQAHLDLDKLFYLDNDGYYRFDSMRNFATIKPEGMNDIYSEGRDFTVYSQPALPDQSASGDNPKFLPLNSWSQGNAPTANPASSERIKQFHFGMTMETPFVMPIDGKVPDGTGNHKELRDMIFEFNGDDDVWVFVDNKLVLDLGGIHDRYGGKINFRTGEVTTNAPPTEHSDPRQPNMYGIKGDPNTMTEEQLRKARKDSGFGRFSQHTIKFFYLERGRGASNCEIHFNLVPVSHGLVVGKRLATDADLSAFDHTGHHFQLEVQYPGEERKPLVGKNYTILQCTPQDDPALGGTPVGAGSTDENGRLWLHAGQRADFVGAIDLKNTSVTESGKAQIYVSEVVPNHQHEHEVKAWMGKEEDGSCLKVPQPDGTILKRVPPLYDSEKSVFHAPKDRKKTNKISNGNETLYQVQVNSGRHNEFNWIDFENDLGDLASLNIKKQAFRTISNSPITNQSFNIKIEFWDEIEKEWMLMEEGSPYWILDKGEAAPGPGLKPTHHLPKDANGQIAIQHDQTIHMKLVPGTRYRVSEVLNGEDAEIYTTTYTGEVQLNNGTSGQDEFDIQIQDQKQTGIVNKNEIAAGVTHNVLITNKSSEVIAPKGSFALTKRVEGETTQPEDTQFNFELRIKDYKPTSANQTAPIPCMAFYHDTPASVTRTDGPINFEIDPVSKEPVANVSLYRGETIVITGLPLNHSMGVHEKLTKEQNQIYEVSIQENKQPVTTGASLEKTVGQINANGVLRVVCTNRSKLKNTTSLQISKEVQRTDQPGGRPTHEDKEKEFNFAITLLNPKEFTNQIIQATITNGAQSREVTLQFEPNANANDYTASVGLKHGETLTVPGLPRDVEVIVQETSHAGYVVSMNKTPGDQIRVQLKTNTGEPYRVDCLNITGVKLPETGGSGRLPYYLFGTLMLCTAGWLLYRRRKRAENV